jgi:hypothetical protein
LANAQQYHPTFRKTLKVLGLTGFLLLFLIPATYAQNTKGDRPESKGAKRENRFRFSKNKKAKPKQPYNRVQGRRSSPANRASASRPPKFYPQKGPFVNNKSISAKMSKQNLRSSRSQVRSNSVSDQQARRNRSSTRVQARSATGSTRNVYPQRGPYMNSSPRKTSEHSVSNRGELAMNKRFDHKSVPPKRKRVTPNSASRSYISRRSINAFAGFWNKKPKGEKAYVGDITGRKLRTKNFETKRPVITNPTAHYYQPKKRVGDTPYKGPGGFHVSASHSGKAWRGDIAGRKIRGRNFTSKNTSERVGQQGGGYRSATGKMKKGTGPLPPKAPGIGANKIGSYSGNIKGKKIFSSQGESYTGNIKSHRPLKGGGSVSGRAWNNNGQAIAGKSPGIGADRIGTYQGNIKGRSKVFTPQGEEYSGNIKAKKPLKGGGSVSGKVWNNNGQSVGARSPSNDAIRAGRYQGNIRGKKVFTPQGESYTGNIKAKKPLKGGGSVSGKVWNNNEQAIAGKAPTKKIRMDLYQGDMKVSKKAPNKDAAKFTGKYRELDLNPGLIDQGEEFSGTKRLPRFKKEYVQNPNSSKESLKKSRPEKSTYLVDGLQIKVKQQDYKKRPHGAEDAMLGIAPGKNSTKAIEFSKGLRLKWDYQHNPNSADEALDTREPGKAFARSSDYQGNIKMKKFTFFGKRDLHPDAQFVKTNKNNTDDERDLLTNFKLWWARTFKKNDTQPDHLKQKIHKPRYDKGEQGLWYD